MSDLELCTHRAVSELGADAWRGLATPDVPPFLHYEWLDALERTGCATPERGWAPLHLSVWNEGRLLAVAPAYAKGNSDGEFVFDHGWARFAEARLGVRYYPKLVVAVPFTPANGPRVLFRPDVDRTRIVQALAIGIRTLCERQGLSGAHVLFPHGAEADDWEHAGFARRAGVQFHWHNPGYADFEAFLARFNSKRRNQIRRERRTVADQGLTLHALTGPALDDRAVADAYEFYRTNVARHYWGRQYLTRAFFERVVQTMPDRLHFVVARDARDRSVGGAFNLLGRDALYGRYWGSIEERPCLHFEACFYRGIQEAIDRKLSVFEPGAGGEHKVARGFEPTITHSVHHLVDRRLDGAVREAIADERAAVDSEVSQARAEGPLRPLSS